MNAARLTALAPSRAGREAEDAVDATLRLMEAIEGLVAAGVMSSPDAFRHLRRLYMATRTINEVAVVAAGAERRLDRMEAG